MESGSARDGQPRTNERHIAWGVALFAKIICEWRSIGKEQSPGEWIPIAVFVGTFVVLLRLLPKDAEPR